MHIIVQKTINFVQIVCRRNESEQVFSPFDRDTSLLLMR